jgi:RNA polymerase sigma-70 factor (ECF subfamily)
MTPSTYIIGQDSNHERYFVIRTESPRFIAELMEPDQADDSLVELVKFGEANAFPELVRRYQGFCTAKAISILRNRGDAEDEVQNMWLNVWMHLATYRGPGVFRVWLGSIISNHCVRRLQRARIAPMTSLDEVLDSEESFQLEVIDQRARPDQAVENAELLVRLNREINGLPPLLRDVLVRRSPAMRDRSYRRRYGAQ